VFPSFDAAKLLAIHQDTLATLHIDLLYRNTLSQQLSTISSLQRFAFLKTLLLDSTALCSIPTHIYATHPHPLAEILPPNLVSLQLVGSLGRLLPSLANTSLFLAEAIQNGRFGSLKRVTCNATHVFKLEDEMCFDDYAVADGFSQVGMEFTYNHPPLERPPLAQIGVYMGSFHCGVMEGVAAMPLPEIDSAKDL
jgi:hypothetical protein